MTLEKQVMDNFMQSVTAEENIKNIKIGGVITRVNILGQMSKMKIFTKTHSIAVFKVHSIPAAEVLA